MGKITDPKKFYKEKAKKLYQQSDQADENYAATLNQYDIKHKNGKAITENDVLNMLNQMKTLHDSVNTHREAIVAENKAKGLK